MATLLDPFDELIKNNNSSIPFVQFFISGMICKMFTHIDDIERLKEKNPLYASYLDRWIAYALKTKLISVEESGDLNLEKVFFKNRDLKFKLSTTAKDLKVTRDVVKALVDLAFDNYANKTDIYSLINFHIMSEEKTQKLGEIFNKFCNDVNDLTYSKDYPCESKKMIAVGISTSTIDHDTFSKM